MHSWKDDFSLYCDKLGKDYRLLLFTHLNVVVSQVV